MSRSKKVRMLRGSISLKLAEYLHTTTRRVQNDVVPYVRALIANDPELRLHLTDALDLDADELGLLMAKKADSKAVTSVIKEVEEIRMRRIASPAVPDTDESITVPSTKKRKAPAKAVEKSPEPVKIEEPTAETQKAEAPKAKATVAKGQRSLFDF